MDSQDISVSDNWEVTTTETEEGNEKMEVMHKDGVASAILEEQEYHINSKLLDHDVENSDYIVNAKTTEQSYSAAVGKLERCCENYDKLGKWFNR